MVLHPAVEPNSFVIIGKVGEQGPLLEGSNQLKQNARRLFWLKSSHEEKTRTDSMRRIDESKRYF